jgi:hypothetical protein
MIEDDHCTLPMGARTAGEISSSGFNSCKSGAMNGLFVIPAKAGIHETITGT